MVTGRTNAASFSGAAPSGYHGGSDAFVASISSDGQLLWSRFFGGTGDDSGIGVAVDSSGNIIIAGSTNSTDLKGKTNNYKRLRFRIAMPSWPS